MRKIFLYKDRFFIEDDELNSPEFFSASITKSELNDMVAHWIQFDVGGGFQNGISWGSALDEKSSRDAALKYFCNLYIGIKNLYEKLQIVCQELDKKENEKEK